LVQVTLARARASCLEADAARLTPFPGFPLQRHWVAPHSVKPINLLGRGAGRSEGREAHRALAATIRLTTARVDRFDDGAAKVEDPPLDFLGGAGLF
jgi:hypothetical protein